MNPEQFQAALAKLGITLNQTQLDQFDQYYRYLIEVNQHVNLTRITEKDEVYLKHFYDSLMGAFAEPRLKTAEWQICDIGAGAGFPSLPLKIAFPQLQVTIVDSLNKRIDFLRQLVEKLGLTGVTLVHGRAEDFSNAKSDHREHYDLVTARAVARLSVLSELCLPAAKVGGEFLAYKAAAAEEELQDAKGAIKTLGGELGATMQFDLPFSAEPATRNLILINKVAATPAKYPRRAGLPNKKPLK